MKTSFLLAATGFLIALGSEANAQQQVQTYVYDNSGRLIATTTAGSTGNAISNFTLDAADNRTGTHATPTSPPSQPERLSSGQQLVLSQQLTSTDGRFALRLQQDGNLVLWFGSEILWQTSTGQGRSWYFRMETSGAAILYDPAFRTLWTSNTAGNSGAYMVLQNDGNLVIRNASGGAIWQSYTGGH